MINIVRWRYEYPLFYMNAQFPLKYRIETRLIKTKLIKNHNFVKYFVYNIKKLILSWTLEPKLKFVFFEVKNKTRFHLTRSLHRAEKGSG